MKMQHYEYDLHFSPIMRINHECKKRGWSHSKLAKESGVNKSLISRWFKTGVQPSVASIEKLCRAFGMPLSKFFAPETDGFIWNGEYRKYKDYNEQDFHIKRLVNVWYRLTDDQKDNFIKLMEESIDNK